MAKVSDESYSNSRKQCTWQFRIDDKSAVSSLEGYDHFHRQAARYAAQFDFQVVAVKNVCLAHSRGRVLIVVGTAELAPR
jgi:hypothetical protein